MIINSKFEGGKCRACFAPIHKGERIEWSKGNGARHIKCAAEGDADADQDKCAREQHRNCSNQDCICPCHFESQRGQKDVYGFFWYEHDRRNQEHLEACVSCQATQSELNIARREREHDEAEYQRGRMQAEQYMNDKKLYGQKLAEQWDIEREMREEDY